MYLLFTYTYALVAREVIINIARTFGVGRFFFFWSTVTWGCEKMGCIFYPCLIATPSDIM